MGNEAKPCSQRSSVSQGEGLLVFRMFNIIINYSVEAFQSILTELGRSPNPFENVDILKAFYSYLELYF